jgi:DNA polymerase-2
VPEPPETVEQIEGFLLSRQWRDTRDGIDLSFWAHSARGPLRISVPGQRAVCFVDRDFSLSLPAGAERRSVELSVPGSTPVDAIYTVQQRQMVELHQQYASSGHVHESDIKPAERYLSERFINAGFAVSGVVQQRDGFVEMLNPRWRATQPALNLRLASIDIETRGLSGELYSIGVHCGAQSIVLMVDANGQQDLQPGTEVDFSLRFFQDESALLQAFFALLQSLDPDVLIGWNLISFDLDFLARKCEALGLPLALGRGGEASAILQPGQVANLTVARVPGRAVLDGIDLLRAAFWSFESFALNHVANQLVGRGKIIASDHRVDEINHLFATDKVALARYNIEDCRLVSEIFERAQLIDFAVQRARMTGLPIDKTGGSVQTLDNLYLPRMHRLGYVAPYSRDREGLGSPGGYVLDSVPGLYRNVIVLDFKSLYPSIIRSFLIDPLGMAIDSEDSVPGFAGASFSRETHILPGLITELWHQRDLAKRDSNAPLSQAIKIIMNSFYGVLGSNGCRFHDHRLASSITRRGHEIIQTSRQLIEEENLQVIYGDTDSLFVLLSPGFDAEEVERCGLMLQGRLNQYWRDSLARDYRLESCLEVEFETHFQRFFMPTVRGSESGSKKRYAGYVASKNGDSELMIKGLEAARTDWTPLAREFQRALFERVFQDLPIEELVRDTREQLVAGALDDKLIYRKRIRRKLTDYQRNVPPHIQAARKLTSAGRWIEYVITLNGPEPVVALTAEPDYEHYLSRQLAPAADGILHCLDTSFEAIGGAQMQLF